jgi:hypothetical protein
MFTLIISLSYINVLSCLQWIELQRDPLGVSDRNGKPHIRAGGNKLKVTSALQTLDDKIRIATKVT